MELYLVEDYKEAYPKLKGSALTDALVRELLVENGYVPADRGAIQILRLPQGKPVLDGSDRIRFSVSHTENLFGCVIDADEVGLDIQKIREVKIDRIAGRYFTPAEQQYIAAGEGEEDAKIRFFRIWCRKEARAKYTGEGLAAVIEGICVLNEDPIDRRDPEEKSERERNHYCYLDLTLGEGIYGCICYGC